jgi:IPT/TIG domain
VLGNTNTDGAVVTGNAVGGSPTGTVTFYECGATATAQSCTSQANQVGSPVALTAGAGNTSSANSVTFTPHAGGYYCFGAYYSGDSNYGTSSDTSTDECFDVTPAASTTSSTPASSRIAIGGTNSDNVTVAGNSVGSAPMGTISFYECGSVSGPAPCTSKSDPIGSASLTPGAGDVSYASSAPLVFNSAGTYCYGVYYLGSPSYSPSNDTATTECFVVGAAPTITSFSPTYGPVGTTVTIKGTNLSGALSVKIGGVDATIVSNTATKIKIKVAAGDHTGKIKVTTPSGSVASATKFTVT